MIEMEIEMAERIDEYSVWILQYDNIVEINQLDYFTISITLKIKHFKSHLKKKIKKNYTFKRYSK